MEETNNKENDEMKAILNDIKAKSIAAAVKYVQSIGPELMRLMFVYNRDRLSKPKGGQQK